MLELASEGVVCFTADIFQALACDNPARKRSKMLSPRGDKASAYPPGSSSRKRAASLKAISSVSAIAARGGSVRHVELQRKRLVGDHALEEQPHSVGYGQTSSQALVKSSNFGGMLPEPWYYPEQSLNKADLRAHSPGARLSN